jgi:hypothetical protein
LDQGLIEGVIIIRMNRRQRVVLILCIAIVVTCVRIRHERLGWGSYWSQTSLHRGVDETTLHNWVDRKISNIFG